MHKCIHCTHLLAVVLPEKYIMHTPIWFNLFISKKSEAVWQHYEASVQVMVLIYKR